MKKLIKSYFTFNKTERRGVFVLCLIMVLFLVSNFFLPYLLPNEKMDYTAFEQEIDAFKAMQEKYNDSIKSINTNYYTKTPITEPVALAINYFNFDPNHLPEEKWKQLGLKESQITIINNYRHKGGKFYKKEDLKKIYGINPELYASLEPFIVIPTEKKDTLKTVYDNFAKTNVSHVVKQLIIELNTANSIELKRLKGIGNVYSERIIKFRDRLGGFIKKEQLLEIYGIDSILYESISDQITINENNIKKLNVNKCSIYDLTKHPYIKNHIALSIVNYREQHGQYKEISEIKNSDLVNEELYLKLAPYLTVE